MLSYPPHSAHQQQATAPMSLAFPRQTQNHHQPLQQQQQSRDEESTDKIPAVGDEELQKPLKVRRDYIFSILRYQQQFYSNDKQNF